MEGAVPMGQQLARERKRAARRRWWQRRRGRRRRRRGVATRIYAGLRAGAGYTLPKHADQNDVLRALCAEAGYLVDDDGNVSRRHDERLAGAGAGGGGSSDQLQVSSYSGATEAAVAIQHQEQEQEISLELTLSFTYM
uniref:Protein BZR1 homolog n=1 Tax=Oryza punctata TaxID=4537 RepID=A0A0E0JET3_ORYPU